MARIKLYLDKRVKIAGGKYQVKSRFRIGEQAYSSQQTLRSKLSIGIPATRKPNRI